MKERIKNRQTKERWMKERKRGHINVQTKERKRDDKQRYNQKKEREDKD